MGALLILIVAVDTCATGWCLARLKQLTGLCAELTATVEQFSADLRAIELGEQDAR